MADAYAHYLRANEQLEALLCQPGLAAPAEQRGSLLVEATRRLLDTCGAPDRSLRCVVVGGTSGKGSTAVRIAAYLQAAGVRVGLHTSPYLQVATEKIAIDGLYLAGNTYASLVDWLLGHLDDLWRTSGQLPRRWGALSLVLATEAMRRAGVEVGIFEVGCGGRFDPVAALDPAVAVISNVGLDHEALLGPGIARIAWHKAGLIRGPIQAITAATGPGLAVIEAEAREQKATLTRLPDDPEQIAPAVCAALGIAPAPVRSGGFLPGRLEAMGERGLVWLDVAHNSAKLAYCVRQLAPRRAVVVLGMLATKSPRPLLKILSRHADTLVTAPVTVRGRPGFDPKALALAAEGLFEQVIPAPSATRALAIALNCRRADEIVLVTGSVYLVGELRNRWYPPAAIVAARHSWPERWGAPEDS